MSAKVQIVSEVNGTLLRVFIPEPYDVAAFDLSARTTAAIRVNSFFVRIFVEGDRRPSDAVELIEGRLWVIAAPEAHADTHPNSKLKLKLKPKLKPKR